MPGTRLAPIRSMDFFDLVRVRRSVRRFHPEPLPDGALERLLGTAALAPSAGNLQSYAVVVVEAPARKARLAAAAFHQACLAEAPVVLVFCADPARSAVRYDGRGEALFALQDATLACAYAQLGAAALGLGSVWVGAFDDQAMREALELPAELRPVAMLPVGRAAEAPSTLERRPLEELVRPESQSFHLLAEHTGELELRLAAPDLPGLFVEGARALAVLIAGEPLPRAGGAARELRVEARDREALLAAWLDDLVYLAETARTVVTDTEIQALSDHALVARGRGAEVTAPRIQIKATTLHRLRIRPRLGGLEATIVLDV